MSRQEASGGLPVLDAVEQRILGSLMEKQRTVPASYPMTLNSLRLACNQTSSRDPVVEYDDELVETSARNLKRRELLRIVVPPRGTRTLKYHERLTEQLELARDEAALVTVLLLRGPQAPGELKTRTERLYSFADRDEVEACLQRLAGRVRPLVRELPRRAGHHDNRWIHLLGPVAGGDQVAEAAAEPAVDWEAALAGGPEGRNERVLATYGAVASQYAEQYTQELDRKPFDTWFLARVTEVAGDAPVADVGCGPGHVAAHLTSLGAQVTGYDLCPEMIAEAKDRFPAIEFEVGDLTRLLRPRAASGWGAIVAWYSLVHFTPPELGHVMTSLVRVLQPGGNLAVALHIGGRMEHLDSWFDQEVSLDWVMHDPAAVRQACQDAGLVVQEWYVRSPIPDVEIDTERLYLIARRP